MSLNRKNKSSERFSLIEFAIVSLIMGMLTTVMLANFRTGEKSKRVQLAADALVNTSRLAQSYSLSGKQIPNTAIVQSGTRCANGDTTAAFYRIMFTAPGSNIDIIAEDKCAATFLIERYTLPPFTRVATNGITLVTCNPACPTSSTPGTLRIQFSPPFARMTASSGGAYQTFTYATFRLESNDGARTKTVRIDGVSGRIDY